MQFLKNLKNYVCPLVELVCQIIVRNYKRPPLTLAGPGISGLSVPMVPSEEYFTSSNVNYFVVYLDKMAAIRFKQITYN
jgi:hypothetical protein